MTQNPEALRGKTRKIQVHKNKLYGKKAEKTHHYLSHKTSDKPGETFAICIS